MRIQIARALAREFAPLTYEEASDGQLLKTPQLQFNSHYKDNFQINGQDADNSSSSDLFDEDNGQISFDSFDQTGAVTLSWSPLQFGSGTGAPSFLGYGWSASPPRASSSADPLKRRHRIQVLRPRLDRRAAGPASSSSSQIVSTSGSGLVFDNTYDASCTAALHRLHRIRRGPARKSLFTNSDTISRDFQRSEPRKNGVALDNFRMVY